MTLRVIALIILVTWLVLVLYGKGGFVHLLLLNGIGVIMVDVMAISRRRLIG